MHALGAVIAGASRRRSAGGGAFDPSLYGTPLNWWKGDDISGANNDPVATWPKRIYGVDATQATSGLRPALKVADVNGHNSVHFTNSGGSDDMLTFADIGLSAYSIFILNYCTADSFLMCRPGMNRQVRQGRLNYQISLYDGASEIAYGAGGFNQWQLSEYFWDGSSKTVRLNGAHIGTDSGGQSLTLSAIGSDSTYGNPINARIAEILIMDAKLIGGNLSAVENYFESEYGLSF